MSIPAPAILAIVALLAWPAAQILAIAIWGRSITRILRETVLRAGAYRLSRRSSANDVPPVESTDEIEGTNAWFRGQAVGVHAFGLVASTVLVGLLSVLLSSKSAGSAEFTGGFVALYIALTVATFLFERHGNSKRKRED